jgi:hypothetical protein
VDGLNYERFGICATVIILVGVLGVSSITTNIDLGIEFQTPNFTDTTQYKSIDDIKEENRQESLETLKIYCESLNIEC